MLFKTVNDPAKGIQKQNGVLWFQSSNNRGFKVVLQNMNVLGQVEQKKN